MGSLLARQGRSTLLVQARMCCCPSRRVALRVGLSVTSALGMRSRQLRFTSAQAYIRRRCKAQHVSTTRHIVYEPKLPWPTYLSHPLTDWLT